jgi:hypothetical protein
MIHSALLKECDDLYDFEKMEINEELLSLRLRLIKDKYSSELSDFIQTMVEFDEDKRLNYEQLIKLISGLSVRNGAKFKEVTN